MRLFFALWPDRPAAEALAGLAAEVARKVDGKAVPPEKVHLTLAFLGEVAEERAGDAASAAERLRVRPFGLAFDTLGWFRGARVAWIGCSDPDPRLVALQSRLAERLRDRGFALDDRPYAPHITLARKAGRPLLSSAVEPIGWRVREVALVRSEAGTGRYTTIGSWKLGR